MFFILVLLLLRNYLKMTLLINMTTFFYSICNKWFRYYFLLRTFFFFNNWYFFRKKWIIIMTSYSFIFTFLFRFLTFLSTLSLYNIKFWWLLNRHNSFRHHILFKSWFSLFLFLCFKIIIYYNLIWFIIFIRFLLKRRFPFKVFSKTKPFFYCC